MFMRKELHQYARALCRSHTIRTERQLEKVVSRFPWPSVEPVRQSLEQLSSVAKADIETEWDNVRCMLIPVEFRGLLAKSRSMVVRISRVAPLACVTWKRHRNVKDLFERGRVVQLAHLLKAPLSQTEQNVHAKVCDTLRGHRLFVAEKTSLTFAVEFEGRSGSRTTVCLGSEFYFGTTLL
jgi:hypothetical protein